jgi:hypothetical protein
MPAAVTIIFSGPEGTEKAKGPFPEIRLEGETIKDPSGNPVAQHENHSWQVDGQTYTRADCSRACVVHFFRADGTQSKSYGPFESVSFVDGVAYADREVFAFADRSIGDWYCHEDGRHYPIVVIQPSD